MGLDTAALGYAAGKGNQFFADAEEDVGQGQRQQQDGPIVLTGVVKEGDAADEEHEELEGVARGEDQLPGAVARIANGADHEEGEDEGEGTIDPVADVPVKVFGKEGERGDGT